MEAEILNEIKVSEEKAIEVIEKAKKEKETIIIESKRTCSKLFNKKKEDIMDVQETNLLKFRDKVKSIKETRLSEGKDQAKLIALKGEENIKKSVEFILTKFEEMMQDV